MQIKINSDSLLKWYSESRRSLPFRNSKDPYKIWISEIMLQQTKMDTAIPFYKRWIAEHPTIYSVSSSTIDDLLKLWEGLGYYKRCLNFFKASKIIVKDYDGLIPADYELFKSLPGVGQYTAGAVMSICYGMPTPAIDGNVKRVFSRIYGYKNITKYNLSLINKVIITLLKKNNPRDFNQSLMELGSLVCKPKNPNCLSCPISTNCKAFETKSPMNYPKVKIKRKIPHYDMVTAIIWKGNKFYIQKRGQERMLGGLWELPGWKVKKAELLKDALIKELKKQCNFDVVGLRKVVSVSHRYSHFSINMHCYFCNEKTFEISETEYSRWIKKNQIDQFPFPKVNHKIFNYLKKYDWNI